MLQCCSVMLLAFTGREVEETLLQDWSTNDTAVLRVCDVFAGITSAI
jgi:hypothetical protein